MVNLVNERFHDLGTDEVVRSARLIDLTFYGIIYISDSRSLRMSFKHDVSHTP